MDFHRSLPFAKLATELGRWIRCWTCWYRSWASLVMSAMVISPLLLVSRVPAAIALSPLVIVIMTLFPLRMSSVEQRLGSSEQVVTLQKQALSSQEKTLCQVTLDLTALQHSVNEQEVSFESHRRRSVALTSKSLCRLYSRFGAVRVTANFQKIGGLPIFVSRATVVQLIGFRATFFERSPLTTCAIAQRTDRPLRSPRIPCEVK